MQLEDIKLICVDFDNTLYLHPEGCKRCVVSNREYMKLSMVSAMEYKDSVHPEAMHKFLQIIQHRSSNARFFMVSHVFANFIIDNKKIAVLRDYPEINWTDFYGCSKATQKEAVLDCLCYRYNYSSSQVLMIDDCIPVLEVCKEAGYHVVNSCDVIDKTLSFYDAEVHGLVRDWERK